MLTGSTVASAEKQSQQETSCRSGSHLEVLEVLLELLHAAAGRAGRRQQQPGVGQEAPQLLQAASVRVPGLQQPLHQGAPLLGPLHHPLPVLPQVSQLQDEAAAANATHVFNPGPALTPAPASCWLPVVHLSSVQQMEGVGHHRVEDLVADGELRLKPLEPQDPLARSWLFQPRVRIFETLCVQSCCLRPAYDAAMSTARLSSIRCRKDIQLWHFCWKLCCLSTSVCSPLQSHTWFRLTLLVFSNDSDYRGRQTDVTL